MPASNSGSWTWSPPRGRHLPWISQDGVSDDVWDGLTAVFDEKEVVLLLVAIAAINVWNRMNVTVHTELPTQPTVAG